MEVLAGYCPGREVVAGFAPGFSKAFISVIRCLLGLYTVLLRFFLVKPYKTLVKTK